MTAERKTPNKSGRKPKDDPATFHYTINLNAVENAEFLARFERSGLKVKAHFITSCIFNRELKVIKVDKATMDYYMRLTTLHSQFRSIGTNYNQATKAIKTIFTEKRALAYIYKLEAATKELIEIHQKVIQLTKEFEEKWLQK
jgi:hypothetical protein